MHLEWLSLTVVRRLWTWWVLIEFMTFKLHFATFQSAMAPQLIFLQCIYRYLLTRTIFFYILLEYLHSVPSNYDWCGNLCLFPVLRYSACTVTIVLWLEMDGSCFAGCKCRMSYLVLSATTLLQKSLLRKRQLSLTSHSVQCSCETTKRVNPDDTNLVKRSKASLISKDGNNKTSCTRMRFLVQIFVF